MAPEQAQTVRQLTCVLLLLASAAVEVGATDAESVGVSVGLAMVWAMLVAGVGWLLPGAADHRALPPCWVLAFLGALAMAPFLVEPLRRQFTDRGYPRELLMIFALRNVGLGLAACGSWWLCARLACMVSLFLMLFAVSLTDHSGMLALLGLYSATGSVWLMLLYWTRVRRYFASSETTASTQVQSTRERLPWLSILIVVALVGSVLGMISVGPQRTAYVLWELLPTSGGTGDYDPFARGGANDGDEEVKGDNAQSTGTIETDSFIDSPMPTLYDMISDTYGEPFRPKKVEHAIGLDGSFKVNETRKTPAQNNRPNREFTTTRRSPREPRAVKDRAARALFEVQGPTPLHVRVAAYDRFDGISWAEAPVSATTCQLQKHPTSLWMILQERPQPNIFAERAQHWFKITKPAGTWLPTPPHLVRLRLGQVYRADYFGWSQDRILRLATRETPSGIVIETESRIVDPRCLHSQNLGGYVADGTYRLVPAGLGSEVRALAQQWTSGIALGWPQIAAVVHKLRSEYTLDPTARIPEDCTDPTGHFLLRARRGSDYQFASAAAILLRTQGYATRLVSGFYVAPDHYDPETRHTPVVPEDIHFWPEVTLASGDWLVLEPTPGYELPEPSAPFTERLLAMVMVAALWGWGHGIEITLGALLAGALWWRRADVLDWIAVMMWRWWPGRTWRDKVTRSLRVLEWRGRQAGQPRPMMQTVAGWLRSVRPQHDLEAEATDRLAAMADWAAYADTAVPPWNEAETLDFCQRILNTWTLRRWRQRSGVVPGGK